MARPIKNNMDYFSHENKMRNDRKIKALRAKFGLQGYAVYNMFLELLCEAELLVIKWDEIEKELISGDFGLSSPELEEITDYMIHIGLLQLSNEWLYCDNLDKKSEHVFDKRTRDLDGLRKINGINVAETQVTGNGEKGCKYGFIGLKTNSIIISQYNISGDGLKRNKINFLLN